jgi:hypothetical protein
LLYSPNIGYQPLRKEQPILTNSGDARAPEVSRYASVHGLEMYYEIHGSGELLAMIPPFLDAPVPEAE